MATGAETLKSTVEQFTTAGNQAFKDNVEKSLASLNEANAYSKKNLEAVVASVTAATKGAEVLGAQAMAFSKKSIEDQVAAAKALAGAKSVQEAVEPTEAFEVMVPPHAGKEGHRHQRGGKGKVGQHPPGELRPGEHRPPSMFVHRSSGPWWGSDKSSRSVPPPPRPLARPGAVTVYCASPFHI